MEIVVADVDGIDIIIVAPKRGSAALLPVKFSASFQGPTAPTGQGPGLQLPAFLYKWGGGRESNSSRYRYHKDREYRGERPLKYASDCDAGLVYSRTPTCIHSGYTCALRE
jgi:hypothetical protein